MRRSLVLLLLLLFVTSGFALAPATRASATISCAEPSPPASSLASPTAVPADAAAVDFPAAGGELTVFAASSLTDAFTKIGSDLEAAHPGLTITFNFAGSQSLVTQLTQGAEADLLASASTTQMTAAQKAGVIDGQPVHFTRNHLTIVVPADNPAGIASPADLAKDGVKIVLAQAEVPVGQYARASLCAMGRDRATYGEGFVDKVAANIVSEEENVKSVLAKIALGEADAGIVYTTDIAAVGSDVLAVAIPAEVNVVATYPIAAVHGGDSTLAAAFITYVLSGAGQATLQTFGFDPR